MTDEVFRIVVTVAVVLACFAFVVQSIVAILFYRTARNSQRKLLPLVDRLEPDVGKVGPLIDRLSATLDRAEPALGRLGPNLDKVGAVADKAGVVVATANRILEENRPRIAEITKEVAGIAHTGRDHVERLGELLYDAGDVARNRLGQIDHAVESTVGQVEQVGDAMRRAVMRPVREVNGIAAGISAAVSTLVHGSRKSSVDTATQDEEMFI